MFTLSRHMRFSRFYGFDNTAELIKKRIVCELCSEFVSVSSVQRSRRAPFHLKPEDVTLRGDGNMSHSLSLTPEMEICSGCLIDWLVERS